MMNKLKVGALVACIASSAVHAEESSQIMQLAQAGGYSLTGLHTDASIDALTRNDFASAETHARAALQLNPSDERAQLALGTIYQGTGRPFEARAIFQTLALTGTGQPITDQPWDMMAGQTAKEIAQSYLTQPPAVPAAGGAANQMMAIMVDESALPGTPTMLVPPPAGAISEADGGSQRVPLGALDLSVISESSPATTGFGNGIPPATPILAPGLPANAIPMSTQTNSTAGAREFIPAVAPSMPQVSAPVDPSAWQMPISQDTSNVVQRFRLLEQLNDAGLVTETEYDSRRNGNIGAILEYSTTRRPAQNLERPVPQAEAVIGRLSALRRSLQMRAVTPRQHELERTMILDALLAAQSVQTASAKPPPENLFEAAALVGRLEGFRAEGLITDSEFEMERAAIMSLMGDEVAVPMAGSETDEEEQMQKPVGDTLAHLASYRSEQAARSGWNVLAKKHSSVLGGIDPTIRRVAVPGRGTFYRLFAGPVERAAASQICASLKRSNQYCDSMPL